MNHHKDRIDFQCGKCYKYIDKMFNIIRWVTDPNCSTHKDIWNDIK